MKRILCTVLFGACITPAFAADIGVSISVGEPGFYGQINIGNASPPQLVYPQPVVVQRSPEFVSAPPIYLHVSPGHEKHWTKHCAEYDACGRRVYFVRDDWYTNEYVPRYRHTDSDHDSERGHGHGRGHDKDHDRDHDEGRGHQDR